MPSRRARSPVARRKRFDTRRAGWAVRRWYRIRHALPSISSALWGAGCYALSERGRQRFGEFPDLVSDDLFVDSLFSPEEVTIVDTDPVVVTAPRRLADLLRILRRSYRTQREVSDRNDGLSEGQRGQLADIRVLLRREPALIIDVFVYVVVIGCARFSARTSRSAQRWERDRSSRELG
ncbi:hypothetical protein [Microbacterium elymi]|uniref:Uncharacterized protein n=1 Tax=Microbacterium elymi TaxID=2909587 RepID=A0ABY5NH40_9MICO|nr:hypothetical protein [Microbacterium elymi]UUT34490.1 hypothetical protein L2X98_28475 [Microbacterium elymi]